MTWIDTIPPSEATGKLATLYDKISGADGQVDNILTAHSLRPHTLEGHMALYKSVLHHFGNRVDRAFLEAVGTFVSMLNGCRYCVAHHFAGLQRQIGDEARASAIRSAFESGRPEDAFSGRELAALHYAESLTRRPAALGKTDIDTLHEAGWSDGEILEINQVVAYFAYANRTVLGLGIEVEGEELGLSPSDEDRPDDWSHR